MPGCPSLPHLVLCTGPHSTTTMVSPPHFVRCQFPMLGLPPPGCPHHPALALTQQPALCPDTVLGLQSQTPICIDVLLSWLGSNTQHQALPSRELLSHRTWALTLQPEPPISVVTPMQTQCGFLPQGGLPCADTSSHCLGSQTPCQATPPHGCLPCSVTPNGFRTEEKGRQ